MRGKGEGSIFKRADGRWEGQIDLGYRSGKRKRQSFYGRTRREVAAKLDEARSKMRDGYKIPPARLTIGELVADWLDETAGERGPGTNAVYKTNARLHVYPNVGHMRLREFDSADIERLQRVLSKEGLGGRTILKVRTVLSGALSRAVRHRLITHNPVTLAEPPSIDETEIRVLSKPEALQFLETVRGDRLEVLYMLMICVGVRRGEVLGLRWADLDWGTGQVRIRRNLQRIQERGGRHLLKPKTRAGRRTLYIPRVLIGKLQEHRDRQQLERDVAGQRWREQGLMFPSTIGTPLEPRNLQRAFDVLRETLGIPELTLHGLRHSATSLYLALGVPPHVVQAIMGHEDAAMTLDIYAHVHDQDYREAAAAMEIFIVGTDQSAVNRQSNENPPPGLGAVAAGS